MLLLAHTGIPLGIAWFGHGGIVRRRSDGANRLPVGRRNSDPSRSISLFDRVDYRVILLGSMLPDIIDKLLGQLLLRDTFSSGRIFGHTLLFAGLIIIAGCYLYIRRRTISLLCLAYGTLAHLCLDEMWLNPRTLLWPMYGWSFGRADLSYWLENVLASLVTVPKVYIPEIIGALILAAFFLNLIRQRRLYSFFKTGLVH